MKKTAKTFRNLIVRKKSHLFDVFIFRKILRYKGKIKFTFNDGSRCVLYSVFCILYSDY
jgi:hypothetical protein